MLLRFRQSEQMAIKCMRGLVSALAASAASDKDLVKELAQMASKLKLLDERPEEDLPQDQADAIFGMSNISYDTHILKAVHVPVASHSSHLALVVSGKLGLDGGIKLDANPVVPPTPAPRSVRAAPVRRRARRAPSSSDDSEAEAEAEGESLDITSVSRVPATPSMTAARSQRASKTAALSKFAAVEPSDSEQGEQSDVTTDEDTSDVESS